MQREVSGAQRTKISCRTQRSNRHVTTNTTFSPFNGLNPKIKLLSLTTGELLQRYTAPGRGAGPSHRQGGGGRGEGGGGEGGVRDGFTEDGMGEAVVRLEVHRKPSRTNQSVIFILIILWGTNWERSRLHAKRKKRHTNKYDGR
ncbi:hypothetical protein EYF80_008517 [Liparis tanakae]|uniref:Uncharacterized protein n=1 Tax=Liparis tanakae TaxID=230148 RepID=A0A4Z2IVD2_9TELE|nr:hypothetical protein EYF80_008517 [Liparis tanakae]